MVSSWITKNFRERHVLLARFYTNSIRMWKQIGNSVQVYSSIPHDWDQSRKIESEPVSLQVLMYRTKKNYFLRGREQAVLSYSVVVFSTEKSRR